MPFPNARPLLVFLLSLLFFSGCALFRRAPEPDPLRLEMVRIRGGDFRMGDFFEGRNTDALPVHPVTVRSFYLSRYEVTYEQYDAFARETGRPLPEDDGYGRGRRAVAHVTWDDAAAFCAHHGLRLPSEAEWEYAARSGGLEQPFAGTADEAELPKFAYFADNSLSFSFPVGMKAPNALGLHDMSGNVAEWIGDYYEKYPAPGREPLPKDLTRSGMRIARGGSLNSQAEVVRTYWRAGTLNDISSFSIGFRCAR